MSDIVERLREHAETLYDGSSYGDLMLGTLAAHISEAADEITRLRGTLADINDALRIALSDDIEGMERERVEDLAHRAAEARAERYRKALEELVGILEIAAVMPEAIHKQMFVSWDDPALERARAALRGEG